MADQQPKDEGFFRKVVRFVANPATDWADLNSRQDDGGELDLEKSELKAMIERKRRNDFVRKREFDMLRKMRREGLSPEQLAALGHSSRIDDSEVRITDTPARPVDAGVKQKIDEIEQQMVGDGGYAGSQKRTPEFYNAPTQPASLPATLGRTAAAALDGGAVVTPGGSDADRLPALPPLGNDLEFSPPAGAASPVVMGGGMSPLAPATSAAMAPARAGAANGPDLEVSEVVHDPDLDEAVIAFANADFAQCEHSLSQLVSSNGLRIDHAETWLVLFDLHRATGQHAKFESLAVDYTHQFGLSPPQWFSMPKMVAEAAAEEKPSGAPRVAGEVGWVCPDLLDVDAIARLRSVTLQLPLPWVFDWSGLKRVDADAAGQLSELLRHWAGQSIEMRWLSGEQFLTVLQDASPTGVRDADPAFWQLRLDALRVANRPDQFDETAIDYCVTYEVSPPSWERAKCSVRISGSTLSTRSPPMSIVSEVSTFVESSMSDELSAGVQVASVDLSGQLVGDIGATLAKLDREMTSAPIVSVSCARLIRVDFVAAGDLLNWVLAKRSENRAVNFVEANRLVALFFGAMGINEHAKVQVRKI